MKNLLKNLENLTKQKVVSFALVGLTPFILNQGCVTDNLEKINSVYQLDNKEKQRLANFSTGAYHVFEVEDYSFSQIRKGDNDFVVDFNFQERGKKYSLEIKSKYKEKLEAVSDLQGEISLGIDFYSELDKGYNWTIFCDGETIRNASSPDKDLGGRLLFGQYLVQR